MPASAWAVEVCAPRRHRVLSAAGSRAFRVIGHAAVAVSPIGAAAAQAMTVTPDPDLLAGRHVVIAAGRLPAAERLATTRPPRGHPKPFLPPQHYGRPPVGWRACAAECSRSHAVDADKPRVMDTVGPVTNGAEDTSGGVAPSTRGEGFMNQSGSPAPAVHRPDRQLIEDVHVRELAFGSGYILTGRSSPSRRPGSRAVPGRSRIAGQPG